MSDLLNTLIQDARVWQGRHQRRSQHDGEPTGYAQLDRQLGGQGWPKGALSECLLSQPGIGELQLVLPLMKRISHSERQVFWIDPPCIPYAPALHRAGVRLDHVVVIRTEGVGDFLWTVENCLKSSVSGLVMAWPGKLARRDTRRLQLAAEASGCVGVLFRDSACESQSSPAALRLVLSTHQGDSGFSAQRLQVNILKRRGGWPGESCSIFLPARAELENETGAHEPIPAQVIRGPWPQLPR